MANPDSTKYSESKTAGKYNRRKLLWLLAVIPAFLIILAASVYGYYMIRYTNKVSVDQSYVNSWNDLPSQTTAARAAPSGTVSSATSQVPTAADASQASSPSDISQAPSPTGVETGPATLADVDGHNDPIIRIDPIDPNIENILLIGIDGGDELNIGHRSDAMLICSINKEKNTVKLTSVMRDIWAYFPSRDAWDKINASYAYGGPGQTVNIVNYNFKLDIQKYVVTDFEGFRSIVNTIGGVWIEVTDKEAEKIPGLTSGGTYLLDGTQALIYSRIRYIDSDFSRVQRQRIVLLSIFAAFRGESAVKQMLAANELLGFIRSNIDASDAAGRLFGLALKIDGSIEQRSIPEAGMYTVHDAGTWYMSLDWEKQAASLHEFIYGTS